MSVKNTLVIVLIIFCLKCLVFCGCENALVSNNVPQGDVKNETTDKNKILITRHVSDTTERIEFKKNDTVMRTRYVPKMEGEFKKKKKDRGKENREPTEYQPEEPRINKRMDKNLYDCKNTGKRSKRVNNNTYTVRNGKKYRVMKVMRSQKCKARGSFPPTHTIQRRTFNTGSFNSLVPNFSFFPVQWRTKQEQIKNETVLEYPKDDGWDFWSKLKSIPSVNDESQKTGYNYHGEKLKKFLNLFTIVKFDNGGCYANGLKGTCYHKVECEAKGGRPMGTCAQGFGICCYIEKTCGMRTKENCTYFVNEGFPKPTTVAPKVCALNVDKADPNVYQIRLEFQTFEIRGPTNGTCLTDRFIVTGQNTNNIVPDICGVNTGQHIYMDVDETKGPYLLNVITMGEEFPRAWRIKVTQLKRHDELIAPKNCLQYYTEPNGAIQTFNYQYGGGGNLPSATPGYFNNLNYAVCVKKQRGFCSITYTNEERSGVDPTFQLTNVDEDGERLIPPLQGGAEIFNCPDDYIIVNGLRLCGERLNDASIEVDYTKNYPVTDRSNGPFVLPVITNGAVTGRGFYLTYKQNPCLG